MKTILIVEDTEIKREAIKDFVSHCYTGCEIFEAASYQDGVDKLKAGPFDIILLDMTMPTFNITTEDKGGAKRPFAGRDLMSKMHRRGYDYPVIVITRFDVFPDEHRSITLEELNLELKREFPSIYKGYVFYEPSKSTWCSELKKMIDKL